MHDITYRSFYLIDLKVAKQIFRKELQLRNKPFDMIIHNSFHMRCSFTLLWELSSIDGY